MSDNYIQMIAEDKVYPIIRCNNAEFAIQTAKAIVDGGIRVIEMTVEHPEMYDAIKEVSKFAHVCAGGIITSLQADAAFNSGAVMFSSPIFQMSLIKISKNKHVPFLAGATTANEAYNAWKSRIPLIKIFPTGAMGGVRYIEDILRQMPFLNLLPMGNVKLNEVLTYIKAGAKAVGVGRDFYQGFEPKEITARTRDILKEIRDYKKWTNKNRI